jgi:transposase
MRIDHGKRFVNGEVCIKISKGSRSFAKELLMKFHGMNPGKFPLCPKELEFRYNHRNRDLPADLLQELVDYSSMACTE